MAGHNKWSKIKHKKAVTDAQKSKVFGKMARLIAVESKKASGDTSAPALRSAIEKAKQENMPNDNIERAVQKGVKNDGVEMDPVLYEAYGPGGCAILIDALTDNRNRTSSEVKHALSKSGASMADPGAASWAFTKAPGGWSSHTTIALSEEDSEKLSHIVLALEDLDDVQEIYTNAS